MNYNDQIVINNMYKFFPKSNNDLRRNSFIEGLRCL